jgi:NADH:ubiquinone oxidoreductase subunit 5 (subunit L)/multisubunit Na+/H+ antiporter MnhA subunit
MTPGASAASFVFLNLFIAMMMILVSGDSYLMLFVGWEGVGLCSFLLIGFWYEMDTLGRPSWANSNAGNKAFHYQPHRRLRFSDRGLHHVLGIWAVSSLTRSSKPRRGCSRSDRCDHAVHAGGCRR